MNIWAAKGHGCGDTDEQKSRDFVEEHAFDSGLTRNGESRIFVSPKKEVLITK